MARLQRSLARRAHACIWKARRDVPTSHTWLSAYRALVNETADATPAWTAWSTLPESVRREVDRLAKSGQRHPDNEVANAAADWAKVLLGSASVENEGGAGWRAAGMVVFFTTLWDTSSLEDALQRRADCRWARRVLSAA
ncbi:MAG: hypothetical protein JWO88_3242 [Frankiales bacterium]|nr:hypothetical protein [Frankiales bacterium]